MATTPSSEFNRAPTSSLEEAAGRKLLPDKRLNPNTWQTPQEAKRGVCPPPGSVRTGIPGLMPVFGGWEVSNCWALGTKRQPSLPKKKKEKKRSSGVQKLLQGSGRGIGSDETLDNSSDVAGKRQRLSGVPRKKCWGPLMMPLVSCCFC